MAVSTYILVPLLLGWLLVVVAASLAELAPGGVRLPTPTTYDPYFDDFDVFYSAGTMVRDGAGGQVYRLSAIHEFEARGAHVTPASVQVLPFFNPAYTLAPLAALSLMPLQIAAVAWTGLGLVAFVTAAVALAAGRPHRLNGMSALVWLAATASSVPFFQTILHGQASFFLAAAWVLIWLGAFAGRRPWLTALGLFLLAFKPPLLLLPIGFLIWRQQWRAIWRFAAVLGVCAAGTMAVVGPAAFLAYPGFMLHAASWDDTNGISTWGMFGWNAFSRALLGPHELASRSALTLSLDVATLVAIARALPRLRAADRKEEMLACLVFGSLLISPHVYAHDVLFAVVPLMLLATGGTWRTRMFWIAYAAAGWVVLYFHFDLLSVGRLNPTALWLAGAIVAATLPAGQLARSVATYLRPLDRVRLFRPPEAENS